ncbi:hypothetical protein [Enterobacter sp. Bisph1]|nr:hypothetical protein [Enterobacter sp. Bisph1]
MALTGINARSAKPQEKEFPLVDGMACFCSFALTVQQLAVPLSLWR